MNPNGVGMTSLFRNQAKNYAASRPSYPPELFQHIVSKCPGHRLAWDVGTGNGQAATSLANIFDSVVATDVSQEQLAHASAALLPNVRFVLTPPFLPVADLHRLVAPPGAVDLVTVAQALHWLDLPYFYDQARAVLRRPGGVVAAWCYTTAVIDGGSAEEIYRQVYDASGPYWAKERRLVEQGYAGVEFPFDPVEGEEGTGPFDFPFAAVREMTGGDFVEYVKSWSAYQTAKEKGVELLTEDLISRLRRAWCEDGEVVKQVRFPISLRIGRVR